MEKSLITIFDTYGREPILRRMKDGTLVCLFLTGGDYEPHNDNVVKISRSQDDGATWSVPEVVISHPFRGCWSTELFAECERPYIVVQTYHAPSHYRELQTFRAFCEDDSGEHWSEPVSFPGHINGCSVRQGIVLSNGDTLFPLYWQEIRDSFVWENRDMTWDHQTWPFICGAGISTDGGLHFERFGYINANGPIWEPNAVEAEPGHVIMYCRCSGTGTLYISESFDYGRTWTRAVDSGIPNPDTKVTLLRAGGWILMVNNFTGSTRTHLEIRRSRDGKRFEHAVCVEAAEETWFYPHGFADEERQILYLAYENKYEHYLKKYSYKELGLI